MGRDGIPGGVRKYREEELKNWIWRFCNKRKVKGWGRRIGGGEN